MGDNAEPDVGMELPWQAPASIFPETWGYRSWQQRDGLQGKIRENITRLVRVVSTGGNYILNIGPEGDGSLVPYEAQVLQGIGEWLKRNGEAIYGTRKQPFAAVDFGYATVGPHALYLFVAKPPTDHQLHVPGLADTAFGPAYRLGSPASTVEVERNGNDISVALDHLAGDTTDAFMPVIVLPFKGSLRVRPSMLAAASDGGFHLQPAQAEHYLNYNGEGYEAPATPYKLSWQLDAQAADYLLTLHYTAAANAKMDAWIDGHRYRLDLRAADTSTPPLRIRRDHAMHPYAMQVELTPAAPFVQGTALPVTVQSVELSITPRS
jgi:alpha-L-fucosidase